MEVISGRVFRSAGLGKKIGFPTLNIHYDGKISGVFVGEVLLNGQKYQAAVNVGGRPTVDNLHMCESYLLDFFDDVEAGTEIEVHLLAKIRDIEKFPNLDALIAQISLDVEFTKNWYNSRS